MKSVVVMMAVFFLFVGGRIYFLSDREVSPERYDKPLLIGQLILPKVSVPSGYTLAMPGDEPKGQIVKPQAITQFVPQVVEAKFPARDQVVEYLVQIYQSSMGEKVRVVTARYKGKTAPSGNFAPPAWMAQDATLTYFDADQPEAVSPFARVFAENAKAQKARRQDLEKVFVAGDAYLRLFMNVLVWAFAFMLFLFFMKYWFIIRPTQTD